MVRFAIDILWLSSLLLPALSFLIWNNFDKHFKVFIRALIAVGIGWLHMYGYAVAAQYISGEMINGSALAFAAIFGWVLPAIVVGVCWLIHYINTRRFKKKLMTALGR